MGGTAALPVPGSLCCHQCITKSLQLQQVRINSIHLLLLAGLVLRCCKPLLLPNAQVGSTPSRLAHAQCAMRALAAVLRLVVLLGLAFLGPDALMAAAQASFCLHTALFRRCQARTA